MANKPRKRRHLLRAIILAALFPVHILVGLIPKNKKLIIFGSALGRHFADNSKYLFLYISRRTGGRRPVFISRNRDLVDTLNNNGYPARSLFSLRGIITVIRADRAFVSHSTEDIHPLLTSRTKVIQLWHGTPLRKISYDTNDNDENGSASKKKLLGIIYRLFPYTYGSVKFDRIVITSDFVRPSYRSAFRIGDDRMEVLGQPRNDCLNPEHELDEKLFPELEYLKKLKVDSELIVAWLPTHRATERYSIDRLMYDYGFDNERVGEILEANNITLLIKPHFLVRDRLKSKLGNSRRIVVYDPVDPYPMLRFTDILITDYSSVYFDFLLTGRPVIFAPFDYEDYQKVSATFYYDYDDVTPGPVCRNWNGILEETLRFNACRKEGRPDDYTERRRQLCEKFNKYSNDFSQRIVERLIP